MMIQSSMDALKAMRFTAMAAELERQLGDPSSYAQLSFEERLSLLVDAEWNRRQQNRILDEGNGILTALVPANLRLAQRVIV